ncbi:MAG TPA: DUF427 domain-containing protein [Steroidobacteraceae bacterium]|nr:DUF427 domain-containing protein [Steroidobacteraceae bacterium]
MRIPSYLLRARERWQQARRPEGIVTPAPGQESVWDYPRPPRLEPTARHLAVDFGGERIADTRRGLRLLETSHPPTYYFPREDVEMRYLVPSERRSICEWKGEAEYFSVAVGRHLASNAVWSYPNPFPEYQSLAGYLAFMPAAMDACWVDGERARPQAGGFYGGWITSDLAGPIKGAPGSEGW